MSDSSTECREAAKFGKRIFFIATIAAVFLIFAGLNDTNNQPTETSHVAEK